MCQIIYEAGEDGVVMEVNTKVNVVKHVFGKHRKVELRL